MAEISIEFANSLIHKSFENFYEDVKPLLERMVNNANIESFSFEKKNMTDNNSEVFITLNLEGPCNGLPLMDSYNDLGELNEWVQESFEEHFGTFDNFFPSIWIVSGAVWIEFYYFEEGSSLKESND